MWTDEYRTKAFGEWVEVGHVIEGPGTAESAELIFPDGSRLSIKFEAALPSPQPSNEAAFADAAERQTATKVFGKLFQRLHRRATYKRVDTDIPITNELREESDRVVETGPRHVVGLDPKTGEVKEANGEQLSFEDLDDDRDIYPPF